MGLIKKNWDQLLRRGKLYNIKKKKNDNSKGFSRKKKNLLNIIINTILVVRKKPILFRGITKKKNLWHRKFYYAKHIRI